MPTTPQEELQRIERLQRELSNNRDAVARVARLEERTMFIPAEERGQGYQPDKATTGYRIMVESFQATDQQLTPTQDARLSRVTSVIDGLNSDAERFLMPWSRDQGSRTQASLAEFTQEKMAQLNSVGETFISAGHDRHFNVVRIKRYQDGTLTYTLYDSGHETRGVGVRVDENGERRTQVNAVEERVIRPGASIEALIQAEATKSIVNAMPENGDTRAYQEQRAIIASLTEPTPIRVDVQDGQRRGNCTTRGQRIMMQDILADDGLAARVHGFIVENTPQSVYQVLSQERENVRAGRVRMPVPELQASESWKPYNSSTLGPSLRFETGYDASVHEVTPEMRSFTDYMSTRGVGVEWGYRDGKAYAYVPQTDQASFNYLEQHLRAAQRAQTDPQHELRLDGANRAASLGPWVNATRGDVVDLRLDVTTMTEATRSSIIEGMTRQGLPAEIYSSESSGRDFIRVQDAQSIDLIREAQKPRLADYIKAIGQPELVINREGTYEYRINVDTVDEYNRSRMVDILSQAGISAEVYEGSRGMVIRTVGAESLASLDTLTRNAPPASPLPPQGVRLPHNPELAAAQVEAQQRQLQAAAMEATDRRAADSVGAALRSGASIDTSDAAYERAATPDALSIEARIVESGAAIDMGNAVLRDNRGNPLQTSDRGTRLDGNRQRALADAAAIGQDAEARRRLAPDYVESWDGVAPLHDGPLPPEARMPSTIEQEPSPRGRGRLSRNMPSDPTQLAAVINAIHDNATPEAAGRVASLPAADGADASLNRQPISSADEARARHVAEGIRAYKDHELLRGRDPLVMARVADMHWVTGRDQQPTLDAAGNERPRGYFTQVYVEAGMNPDIVMADMRAAGLEPTLTRTAFGAEAGSTLPVIRIEAGEKQANFKALRGMGAYLAPMVPPDSVLPERFRSDAGAAVPAASTNNSLNQSSPATPATSANLDSGAAALPAALPTTTTNDGPSASLVSPVADAPAPELRVGQAGVEQLRPTSHVRPATADASTYSPTAVLAANSNEVGTNGRTAVTDAGGRNSAAQFMPSAVAVPVAANDGAHAMAAPAAPTIVTPVVAPPAPAPAPALAVVQPTAVPVVPATAVPTPPVPVVQSSASDAPTAFAPNADTTIALATVAVAAAAASAGTEPRGDGVPPGDGAPPAGRTSMGANRVAGGAGLAMATHLVQAIQEKLARGEEVSAAEYIAAGVNVGYSTLDTAGITAIDDAAGRALGSLSSRLRVAGGPLVQAALAVPMIYSASETGDPKAIGAATFGAIGGVGAGMAGQALIPVPGVGFVIGVVVGEGAAVVGGLAVDAIYNEDPAKRAAAVQELRQIGHDYIVNPLDPSTYGSGVRLSGAIVSSVGRAVNTIGEVASWGGGYLDGTADTVQQSMNQSLGRYIPSSAANILSSVVVAPTRVTAATLQAAGTVVATAGTVVDAVGQGVEVAGETVSRTAEESTRIVGRAGREFSRTFTREYDRDPTVRGAARATVAATVDVAERAGNYAVRRANEALDSGREMASAAGSWLADRTPSWLGGNAGRDRDDDDAPARPAAATRRSPSPARPAANSWQQQQYTLDGVGHGTARAAANHMKAHGVTVDKDNDGLITRQEFGAARAQWNRTH